MIIQQQKINTPHFDYYYTIGLIKTLEEFEVNFTDAYSDATNGQDVIILSNKEIGLDPEKLKKSGLKFELNFTNNLERIFYLVIHADGDCWDFISNFENHPFQEMSIHEED